MNLRILAAFALLALTGGVIARETAPEEVLNFTMLDHRGRAVELRRLGGSAVVLMFTANGCPVARQNVSKMRRLQEKFGERGVTFLLVNSSSADDRASISKEAQELHAWHLPVLKDATQGVARHLGIKRTAEVIVINTKDWTVFYRGAIDDQATEGAQKPEPTQRYLATALNEFLEGKAVTTPRTAARGCIVHYDAVTKWNDQEVSYADEVVPLLERKCVQCHSPGNIGSWAMSSHRKVKGMASMIEEVLLTHRMPPWDADPHIGKFTNDSSLSIAEAQLLLRWIEQGAPRGAGDDPLEKLAVKPSSDWPLGQPDIVLRLPQPERVPATGVLDYRHIEVRASNAQAGWVGALWVKPGNAKVLHHVIARVKNDGFNDHLGGREMFAGWAPGTTQGRFPPDTGKFLPPDARFDFELHYVTIGSEQTDQTEIGLYLLPEKPKRRYESVPVVNTTFEIPPGAADVPVNGLYGFTKPATLYSVTPHMHLRGRSMKFDLLLPSGRRQTVCSVPRYDFNWQHTYALEKPIKIPASAWAMLSGSYDNSVRNPANPDPKKAVHWGDQTFDEMFLGWYNVAWDLDEPVKTAAKSRE